MELDEKYPFIRGGEDVQRRTPRHWVWRCTFCAGPDDAMNSASVQSANDMDPADPDFTYRYQEPALGALNQKARQHLERAHPGIVP